MGICHSSSVKERKKAKRSKSVRGIGNDEAEQPRTRRASSRDFAAFIGTLGFTAAVAPGRIFSNGACRVASLYTQQGWKGTNQDAMLFWENFLVSSNETTTFCAVLDGHGPYGHLVARRVRDALPLLIQSQWLHNGTEGPIEPMRIGDDLDEKEAEKVLETYLPIKNSILMAFKLMDEELKLNPSIDCFCSGTTAVTLIKQGGDLIIGNVGDSRAVLATRDAADCLVPVQITVDLKPDLPREAERIKRCRGRVFALQDEPEVVRLWLPNSDSPGLAMARAFGDFCLKDFGLISIPEVYHHHISTRDEFVILATDGVWDVLSNKEAVDIVASAPSRATAARALVECATRAWKLKYPTSKIDDCAAVCLFFDDHPSPPQQVVDASSKDSIAARSSSLEKSNRSIADCLTNEEEEWSALQGVSRVNSLVSLPRSLFLSKGSTSRRGKHV